MALAPAHTLSARLRRMVETIVSEGDPAQIVLFGSQSKTTSSLPLGAQARGDATETSDVDLLIVVDEPFQSARERVETMTRLWRALSDIRGPKDLLVYSKDEVARWKDTSNHVVARALREGEVLYDR